MKSTNDPLLEFLHLATNGNNNSVDALIMRHIHALPIPKPEPSKCLIQELGNFLTRTTNLLAMLAHDLAHCREIVEYGDVRIHEMDEENALAEMGDNMALLNDKHKILR
jgi:hypothetical protein